MSYTTVWVDDDIVATSEDELTRVVLRPDEDCSLDGDYLAAIVAVDRGSFTRKVRTYHPNPVAEAAVQVAVEQMNHWLRDECMYLDKAAKKLRKYVKKELGAVAFTTVTTDDSTYFLFDTAALRKLWGNEDPQSVKALAKDADAYLCAEELNAWLEGECYGVVVQTRTSVDSDDWTDTEDVWGHIGRTWAEQAAREALRDATGS